MPDEFMRLAGSPIHDLAIDAVVEFRTVKDMLLCTAGARLRQR